MAAIRPKYNYKNNKADTHFQYFVESNEKSANTPTKRIEENKQKIDDLEQAERAEKDAKDQPAEKKKKTF